MTLRSYDVTGGLVRKNPSPLLVLAPVPCTQIRLGSARDPQLGRTVPSVVLAFDLSGLVPAGELRFAALELTGADCGPDLASDGWHLAVLTPDRSPPDDSQPRPSSLREVGWLPRRVPGNPAGWCSVQLPLGALSEGLAAGRVALLLRLPAAAAAHFVTDPGHEHAPRLRLAYDAAGEVAP